MKRIHLTLVPEFLSNQMAIKTVDGIDEAIAHITEYSSKHSEAIVAENETILSDFLNSGMMQLPYMLIQVPHLQMEHNLV